MSRASRFCKHLRLLVAKHPSARRQENCFCRIVTLVFFYAKTKEASLFHGFSYRKLWVSATTPDWCDPKLTSSAAPQGTWNSFHTSLVFDGLIPKLPADLNGFEARHRWIWCCIWTEITFMVLVKLHVIIILRVSWGARVVTGMCFLEFLVRGTREWTLGVPWLDLACGFMSATFLLGSFPMGSLSWITVWSFLGPLACASSGPARRRTYNPFKPSFVGKAAWRSQPWTTTKGILNHG